VLAIFLCIFNLTIPIITTYTFSNMPVLPYRYLKRKVYCLKQRGYFAIVFVLLLMDLCLMIVIMANKDWIEREEDPVL